MRGGFWLGIWLGVWFGFGLGRLSLRWVILELRYGLWLRGVLRHFEFRLRLELWGVHRHLELRFELGLQLGLGLGLRLELRFKLRLQFSWWAWRVFVVSAFVVSAFVAVLGSLVILRLPLQEIDFVGGLSLVPPPALFGQLRDFLCQLRRFLSLLHRSGNGAGGHKATLCFLCFLCFTIVPFDLVPDQSGCMLDCAASADGASVWELYHGRAIRSAVLGGHW